MAQSPDSPDEAPPNAVDEPTAELVLREPLPAVVETESALSDAVAAVAAGHGPIALDAERASGYRYSSRAYLIQLRRENSGTALIDPIAFSGLEVLGAAFGDAEWILHAASQDLPCLREVGLVPTRLFDTELAARLLGYPRVGLATLVETILGHSLRKEHSAVDWSKRPLPEPWLEYAALDVEVLLELRDVLGRELIDSGKDTWAAEEFQHLIDHVPPSRAEPWRRTSGIHKARGRRAVAAVRELWLARDDLASRRDTAPGRLVPDSALIVAANALPMSRRALLETSGFHGRGAQRFAEVWVGAIARARGLPESELPPATVRNDGPPQLRAWAERDPVAAARLATAKADLAAFCEEHRVPMENLLTPDYLRRVIWRPPAVDADLEENTGVALTELGARAWQVAITSPVIAAAIRDPRPLTPSGPVPAADPEPEPGPSSA